MTEQIRRFPKFLSTRTLDNETRAVLNKMQPDPHGAAAPRQNMRLPDSRVLAHVANTTIGNIRDARNLFQILPDMDYARQILISATLAPGDLTDTKIIYTVKNRELDSNLTGPLLRKVQEFFDDSYRIRSLLHPILNDVLFEKGSYPILTLPESSIDRIINADNYKGVSMESAVQALDGHIREETDGQGRYVSWGVLGPAVSNNRHVDSYTGVSFESLRDTGGYVSAVNVADLKVSLESMVSDAAGNKDQRAGLAELSKTAQKLITEKGSTMEVLDNLNILKRPMVIETRRKLAVRRIYGGRLHAKASLESRVQNGDPDARKAASAIERSFYSKRRYSHVPVQPVMTKSQAGVDTYGHPLVIHLPPESVIPIHAPGNPAEHKGYYVMLDIDGNPISVADQNSYYDDIKAQMNNVDSFASQMIQQARRGFEGMGGFQNEIIDELGKIHAEAVESDLLARLRSGALSGNYELGKSENLNRIWLARHLKGTKTMMLFVPAEMMTYIAFDYNEYGVGKTVLEDGKILGSIRAAIMLANTLATLNNAVGGKTLEITLDPQDEDPVSTVEFMLSEYAKVNSQGFSRIVGSTHPLGLADQIQNHGVNVVVSGNTRYPETKLDVSQREGTSRPIDTDMEEMYRKRHIQMFGLSPEIMEGLNSTDFATTVVQNNLMLLKRVIQNQEKFDPFLTDFIRNYIINSGVFMTEIKAFIRDNKTHLGDHNPDNLSDDERIEQFIYDFVDSLHANLPAPETGDVRKSMEAFDAYSDALDKVLPAYVSEEMFATDTSIGMEEMIPTIIAATKAEFQRRWLRQHNVMAEVDVFTTVDEEDGSPVFDLLEAAGDHLDGLNGSIASYVKALLDAATNRAKVLKELGEKKEELQALKDEAGGNFDGGGDDGGDDLDGESGGDETLDAEGDEDFDLDAAPEDDGEAEESDEMPEETEGEEASEEEEGDEEAEDALDDPEKE